MTASLLAAANVATEDWRKDHNLSQYGENKAPTSCRAASRSSATG